MALRCRRKCFQFNFVVPIALVAFPGHGKVPGKQRPDRAAGGDISRINVLGGRVSKASRKRHAVPTRSGLASEVTKPVLRRAELSSPECPAMIA